MPMRSEWKLAREGVTLDTLLSLLHHTALNPYLTLPFTILSRWSEPGKGLAAEYPFWVRIWEGLFLAGVLWRVGRWVGGWTENNWAGDDGYEWGKEVVVVTGGSDGIGGLVVRLLAERGGRVAVLDVQGLRYEAPPSVTYFPCDLTSLPSITSAAQAIKSTLGNPTILINNAGVARGKSILATTEKDLDLTFRVNTLSHYHLAQAFLPSMIAANHGMVVTVASLAGYITAPGMVDYAASKAAAISFHEGLAAELVALYGAPRVRTVLVTPGYTRTALFEGFGGSVLFAETVAEEIVRAVWRGRSGGLCLPVSSWVVAAGLRGWPLGMAYAVRRRLLMMRGWKGRQVVQPSEKGEAEMKEAEKEVDDSTVLVSGE